MITHIFSMKTVSQIGLSALLVATLSGCKEFRGEISVVQPFAVNVVKGKNIVPTGRHAVKVDFPERGKARIEVSLPGKNTNPRFYIKLPRQNGLNQQNGPVSIKAEESGQPFDIVGDIMTEQYDTATVQDIESCTYTEKIRECTTDVNNVRTCIDQYVTKSGVKRVEYFKRITTQRIYLQLLNIAAEQQLATLDGSSRDSQKIYTHEGRCRVRHGGIDGGIDFL